MIRSTTMDITFCHAFALKGLESAVPPGTYRIDIEEEPIEGLSFLAYRRLATFIRVPVAGRSGSTRTCWSIRRSWNRRCCVIRRLMRQWSEGRSVQRQAGPTDVHAMEGAW